MKQLKSLIKKALTKPPAVISNACIEYYRPYYHLMYLLAKQMDDGFLVELGVHKGRGVACLAAGNSKNLVLGLDTSYLEDEIRAVTRQFPNILFLQKPALPVPIDITRPINLLHVDTEHSYANAKAEFEAYRPYLAKGAYVLFDDLHAMDDGVLRYFNELPYEKVQDDRLHPTCGYGVLIYE